MPTESSNRAARHKAPTHLQALTEPDHRSGHGSSEAKMLWRKRSRRTIPAQGIRNLFHGVAIDAADDCCPAAAAIEGQRFLSEEAPLLPLEDCDRRANCRCRYRHFADRRTEARRESDLGLPTRMYPEEKRAGRGRRITDV